MQRQMCLSPPMWPLGFTSCTGSQGTSDAFRGWSSPARPFMALLWAGAPVFRCWAPPTGPGGGVPGLLSLIRGHVEGPKKRASVVTTTTLWNAAPLSGIGWSWPSEGQEIAGFGDGVAQFGAMMASWSVNSF